MIAEQEPTQAPRPVPPSPQVGVTADPGNGRLTLTLSGDIDIVNAVDVSRQARAIIANRLPRHVIIDVAGVEFCDSAGVRMLTELHDRIIEAGITCCLHRPGPLFRWLLRSLGVLRLVDEPGAPEHDAEEPDQPACEPGRWR